MSEIKINKNGNKIKNKESNEKLIYSLYAILFAFLFGIILMIFSGQIWNIKDFFVNLILWNFGSGDQFAQFLGVLSWMIPLGLAMAISFRIGIFNIGSAGQLMAGGLVGFMFASNVNMGSFGFIFILLISIMVGSLIALLISFLKTKFNIHEVISSIMLNWIIFYIFKYFTGHATILDGNSLRFDWLDSIFYTDLNSGLNIGIIIALIILPIFSFLYKKTTWGYKQTLIGNNPTVSDYIGLNKNKEIVKTMLISGGLAGLSGAIYYVGFMGTLPDQSPLGQDIPGFAFDGITITLIGFNSPIGIFLASLLIGVLSVDGLDGIIGSLHIVDIMMAIMIIFLSIVQYKINFKVPKIKSVIDIPISENKNDFNKEKKIKKIKKGGNK